MLLKSKAQSLRDANDEEANETQQVADSLTLSVNSNFEHLPNDHRTNLGTESNLKFNCFYVPRWRVTEASSNMRPLSGKRSSCAFQMNEAESESRPVADKAAHGKMHWNSVTGIKSLDSSPVDNLCGRARSNTLLIATILGRRKVMRSSGSAG